MYIIFNICIQVQHKSLRQNEGICSFLTIGVNKLFVLVSQYCLIIVLNCLLGRILNLKYYRLKVSSQCSCDFRNWRL